MQRSTRRSELASAPMMMTLRLRRMEPIPLQKEILARNNQEVKDFERLRIRTRNEEGHETVVDYKTMAVIHHEGTEITGHYTAHINVEGKWLLCDDSEETTQSDTSSIGNNQAYVFFCRRIDGSINIRETVHEATVPDNMASGSVGTTKEAASEAKETRTADRTNRGDETLADDMTNGGRETEENDTTSETDKTRVTNLTSGPIDTLSNDTACGSDRTTAASGEEKTMAAGTSNTPAETTADDTANGVNETAEPTVAEDAPGDGRDEGGGDGRDEGGGAQQ